MRLKDSDQVAREYSAKASDVNRQISFAGIAAVWLFREGDRIPGGLRPALFFLVLSFLFELLQYTYATAAWRLYHNRMERELALSETAEFTVPRGLSFPTEVLFWSKILTTAIAYAFIAGHVLNRVL
jgi:hypothetical protein